MVQLTHQHIYTLILTNTLSYKPRNWSLPNLMRLFLICTEHSKTFSNQKPQLFTNLPAFLHRNHHHSYIATRQPFSLSLISVFLLFHFLNNLTFLNFSTTTKYAFNKQYICCLVIDEIMISVDLTVELLLISGDTFWITFQK